MAAELQLTENNPYTALTIKQRRYVEARMQGLTMSASARAAGLEPGGCSTIENSPKVRAAIHYLVKQSTASVEELTKSDVLTGMMDAVSAAATASELVMAWREIGKLLGVYEPERRVLEVKDYTQDELKSLSDRELAQLAGSSMKELIVDAEFTEVAADEPE